LATTISVTPPSFEYVGGQVTCVDFSVLDEAKTFPAGVDGHFFHVGPNLVNTDLECPMMATFSSTDDMIVLAIKQVGAASGRTLLALWGITVPTLCAWKPPSKVNGTVLEDLSDKLCTSVVLPHGGLEGLKPLVNSESHKFIEMLELLLPYIGVFKKARCIKLKDFNKLRKASGNKNIIDALMREELDQKKALAKKGAMLKDTVESTEPAAIVRTTFDAHFKNVKLNIRCYEMNLDMRTFLVKTNDVGQIADEDIAALKATLRCT